MDWSPKAVGTARALRWGAWQVAKAAVVLTVVAAGAYGVGLVPAGASGPSDGSGSAPATTATPTESQPAGAPSISRVESQAIGRTNSIRVNHSLTTLERSQSLNAMAQYHSDDMANNYYYSHTSPGGESVADRFDRFAPHCRPGSENIHRGQFDARMRIYGMDSIVDTRTESGMTRYLVQGWMHSEGHRENMLDPRWSSVGIGITQKGDRFYATIVFC